MAPDARPDARTISGVTIWKVLPGRGFGQRTGLKHLTWAGGPGHAVHLHDGGGIDEDGEYIGRDTGTVSGPHAAEEEARQSVYTYLATLDQEPPRWLSEILRIAGDISPATATEIRRAAEYGYHTRGNHGEAWAEWAARNSAKSTLAGVATDNDPAVQAAWQAYSETRERADTLLAAAAGADGRVRVDLDNPESLAAYEADHAAEDLYERYSQTHGEASERHDAEVRRAWREADLDFVSSHRAELEAADPEGYRDILEPRPAAPTGETGRDRLIEEAAERFPEYSPLDRQQAAIDADARANWDGAAYPPYEGPGYTEPPVNWEGWHSNHSDFERDHYWDPESHHAEPKATDLEGFNGIREARTEDSSLSAGPAASSPPTGPSETTARHAQGAANSSENGPDITKGPEGPTETPAERIAGNLALDIYEGRVKPGTRASSPDELASLFGVVRPTAIAALTRLERAGVLRGDPSGAMYVTADRGPALAVTAGAAMCSRLAAQAGGAGDGAVEQRREQFLSAARRAMRSGLTEQDPAVVAARKVLVGGGRVADPDRASWPGTAADGIAARPGQTAGAQSPGARPVPSRRWAASTAAGPARPRSPR